LVQVTWTARALADLNAIQAHIQQFRPLAAQRMALRLKLAAASLAENPDRGRQVGWLRELATVPPYLIRYRIVAMQVQIIRIKHGAQLN
jgi:plasmid stabilization system protein ParE